MTAALAPFDFQGQTFIPVPDVPYYFVSADGDVLSIRRTVPRLMSKRFRHDGYLFVRLRIGPRRFRDFPVHRLVASAFHGSCPIGMECRHLNGNQADNRASNLAWGTRSENTQDSLRHGTHHMAARSACSNGHEYTPENTRSERGRRICRTCARIRTASYRSSISAVAS